MKKIMKPTKNKVEVTYKSVYMTLNLAKDIEKLAIDNDTSFNNTIISLLEFALEELNSNEEKDKLKKDKN